MDRTSFVEGKGEKRSKENLKKKNYDHTCESFVNINENTSFRIVPF